MLRTRFTDLLGLSLPVMNAPMSNHSGGTLAAAVSAAGGLGAFGASNGLGSEWLREQIAHVRTVTDGPFGVGFITQLIEPDPENFEIVVDEGVPVVIFSFTDPQPWLGRARDAGAITICQVQSLELARLAADAGADALLVQGNEAGGHTGGMNLLPLLVAVVEAYPQLPVLAAGGITTGRAWPRFWPPAPRAHPWGRPCWRRRRRWRRPMRSRSAWCCPMARIRPSRGSTTCWAIHPGLKASRGGFIGTVWCGSGTVGMKP